MSSSTVNNRLKAFFILSLIVPIGFVSAFKITGILSDNTRHETIILEPVEWNFTRPNRLRFLAIDHTVEATYADVSGFFANFSLTVGIYQEDALAYEDHDLLGLRIRVNAMSISHDIFLRVYVKFEKDINTSLMSWLATYFETTNLTLARQHSGRSSPQGYEETYAYLEARNAPMEIAFAGSVVWIFLTPSDCSHLANLHCEITYFNGTAYRTIIQSFRVLMRGMQE